MLVHAAAFNLSLAMRRRFGFGTPRAMQGLAAAAAALADASARDFAALLGEIGRVFRPPGANRASRRPRGRFSHDAARIIRHFPLPQSATPATTSSTAC